jgi:hypothetical protein
MKSSESITGQARIIFELNVLIGQYLNRRIAEIEVMPSEVKAWKSARYYVTINLADRTK